MNQKLSFLSNIALQLFCSRSRPTWPYIGPSKTMKCTNNSVLDMMSDIHSHELSSDAASSVSGKSNGLGAEEGTEE
jgi:hypothetical protein